MRKMLLSICLPISFATVAQIPNPGFELFDTDGHLLQWSKSFLQAIVIDSNGNSHGDSITYDHPDHQLYRPTTDAHSGSYAVEMTNAYNHTAQWPITGGVFLATEDNYGSTFPQLIFIQPQDNISSFSFYAKYFPEGNDEGYALLTVYDENAVQLGQAEVLISGLTDQYTLFTAPVVYTETGQMAAISVSFLTASDNDPAPGTRLLVDDISTTTSALGLAENKLLPSAYPNPANTHFYAGAEQPVITNLNGAAMSYSLNADGSVDCSSWASGVYLISGKAEQQPIRIHVIH